VYGTNFLPFAVIEVKKPCNSKNDRLSVWLPAGDGSNVVAGQVFDAMAAIQLYGFPRMCGMISTGNHWRLVGTFTDDEQSDLGRADEIVRKRLEHGTTSKEMIQEIKRRFNQHDCPRKRTPQSIEEDFPEQPKLKLQCDKEESRAYEKSRVVWASKIVPSFESVTNEGWSGEEEIFNQVTKSGTAIVSLITLFIVKACETLLDFLESANFSTCVQDMTIRSPTPCRILKSNENVVNFGAITLTDLSFDKFDQNHTTLYVIYPLGMGCLGKCSLAVSESGKSCCAVKFFHSSAGRANAERERSNWNKVYANMKDFPTCRVIQAAGGYCLVMPYLHPIPKADRERLMTDGSMEASLQSFCSSGLLPLQIKWRHFGLWKGKVGFQDFGMVEAKSDNEERMEWYDRSINELRHEAGLLVVADETPKLHSTQRTRRRK
jgi:hypothetical protein